MATSYYTVPSSTGMTGYGVTQSASAGQPTMPTSAVTYSYNTGQTAMAPNSAVSYAGYVAPPAAPGSAATAAPPPPPMAGADTSQYGVRPPLPPGQATGAEVCTYT